MKYLTLKKFFALSIIFIFISNSFIYAEEIPNKEIVKQAIIQEVHQGASTISPQTNSTSVANTGDNTQVDSSNSTDSSTAVNNTNNADVNQNVNASANTGDNEASGNISIGGNAGVIETGDASVNVLGVVSANNSTTGVGGAGGSGMNDTNVTNTGDGLVTNTSSDRKITVILENGNAATIVQSANTSANTGGNVADGNISVGGAAGVILTGSASTTTSFLVTANGSVALVGGEGNGDGPGNGASIVVTNTGDNADMGSRLSERRFTVVNNYNNALITQSCGLANEPGLLVGSSECYANTGNNTSNGGIAIGGDAGVIETADAEVNVAMVANANNNTTGVSGAGCGASNETGVINTGNDSNFESSADCESAVGVNNTNNAAVSQRVNAYANTGRNQANGNISIGGNAGVINTGNAKVNVVMVADVHDNITGIGGGGAGVAGVANSLGVINTGKDTTISANTTSETAVDIFNTNFLDLFQNAWQWVNTGLNKAVGNIGHSAGIITTGKAIAMIDMSVHANENKVNIGGGSSAPTSAPTAIPTPQQGGIGGSESSNGSTSSSAGSSLSSSGGVGGGSVLGVSAGLPVTGAAMTLITVLGSIATLAGGLKLRKTE